jgi:hypothetical protein
MDVTFSSCTPQAATRQSAQGTCDLNETIPRRLSTWRPSHGLNLLMNSQLKTSSINAARSEVSVEGSIQCDYK